MVFKGRYTIDGLRMLLIVLNIIIFREMQRSYNSSEQRYTQQEALQWEYTLDKTS